MSSATRNDAGLLTATRTQTAGVRVRVFGAGKEREACEWAGVDVVTNEDGEGEG